MSCSLRWQVKIRQFGPVDMEPAGPEFEFHLDATNLCRCTFFRHTGNPRVAPAHARIAEPNC